MQLDHSLGRNLWRIAVIAVLVYVASDLVHHPFAGSVGDAAPVSRRVALWMSEQDAEAMTRAVARALPDHRLRPVRHEVPGSASEAISMFFGRHGPDGTAVLVITSTTLSDLARERSETLLPSVSVDAAAAQGLLAPSVPVGMVSSEPLAIAVRRHSRIRTVEELLATIRARPRARVFGVADTWSRANFTALVDKARRRPGPVAGGRVPFRVYGSPANAAQAVRDGEADALLAPRSTIESTRGTRPLRTLAWSALLPAPRSWVALVARPDLPRHDVDRLRAALRSLRASPGWRRRLAAAGQTPGDVSPARLPALLRHAQVEAASMQRIAERLER